MATLSERLQAEIDRANTTTNKTDKTVHDAVGSLIDGYGVGGLEPTEHSWNQIPTLVKNYLDNVTYDSSDYTTSQIANYAPSTADINNTYPIGVTVETSSGILDREGYEISVSDGNVVLLNDIPNQITEYVVRNGSVVSKVGTIKPTGFLRQIKSAFAINVRDLGGWSCDGGTVKYGKMFRGGEINVNDRDVLVNQCGVKYELNLRGVDEASGRVTSPLGSEIGYSLHEGNSIWYDITNTSVWKEILRHIFDNVFHDNPVYFHCAAGADRTGTLSCIIEAILGVSQSDIDKDYELTSFDTGTSTDTKARRRNEAEWQKLINQITALTVGSTFRDKVLNWVASLGFTVDEINAFRMAMIDGTPDTISLDIETFSISKTGQNVTFDNEATTISEYQPYVVNITPNVGNLIKSVTVKMDGVDITKTSFEGAYLPSGTLEVSENGEYDVSDYENVNVNVDVGTNATQYTVTKTLSNTSSNNSHTEVISGQSYGEMLTVNDGYGISSITVKMGGTDITTSVLTLVEEV